MHQDFRIAYDNLVSKIRVRLAADAVVELADSEHSGALEMANKLAELAYQEEQEAVGVVRSLVVVSAMAEAGRHETKRA